MLRIIDYIIEQAERYDSINIKIEEDALKKIRKLYDDMGDRILLTIDSHGDIDTSLKHQNLCNRIDRLVENFYSDAYKVIIPAIEKYVEKGYINTNNLIEVGLELENQIQNFQIREMARRTNIGNMPDPNAIEFMKKHAFEQVTNVSNTLMQQTRTAVGELFLQDIYDRNIIRERIEDVLRVNRSRADMIVQTELSMAYNQGFIQRMGEFNEVSNRRMMKYWHGFKYSKITCTYCRPRIGNKYTQDDHSEVLPAHPRCRCVWLPFIEGWDRQVSTIFTRNINMLKRVYTPDDIYRRMNERLNIDYASYLKLDDAVSYMSGDRSSAMLDKLSDARERAIKDTIASFNIATMDATMHMGREFNQQMRFWRNYVATAIVDKNDDVLDRSYEAVKGVMILPWNGKQLNEWNKLLRLVGQHL